jgi:hypothetical protein
VDSGSFAVTSKQQPTTMKALNEFPFLLLAAAAATSYGQGTVSFFNSTASAITNVQTMQGISPGEFKVSLYFMPWTSDAEATAWWFSGYFHEHARAVATGSLILPGIFNAGTVRIEEIYPPGGYGWFQVRAWEVAYGDSYEEVLWGSSIGGRHGYIGTSNIIKVRTGSPFAKPPALPGSLTASGLKSFYVGITIPEPLSIAVSFLAFTVLGTFRRRKPAVS